MVYQGHYKNKIYSRGRGGLSENLQYFQGLSDKFIRNKSKLIFFSYFNILSIITEQLNCLFRVNFFMIMQLWGLICFLGLLLNMIVKYDLIR